MTLLADPSLAALLDIAKGLVFVVFVVCALLLMIVVLLQEGKGGGLGSAFGGAAADAFGVKAGTVSRFTTWLATGFLGLALLYAGLSSSTSNRSMVPDAPEPVGIQAPDDGGDAGDATTPPAEDAGDAPAETPTEEGTEGDG